MDYMYWYETDYMEKATMGVVCLNSTDMGNSDDDFRYAYEGRHIH
jgi:hypothetical protein